MRVRERSMTIQFLTITILSVVTYSSLKLTPLIYGKKSVESNIIFPIVYALQGCANGCVFMFMNEEINDDIMKKIFKNNNVHPAEGENPMPLEVPQLMI
uniref:7TM_GPCR_Srx domain-containing protein n=1 Tax=Caenorhabditis tropicalis TaxID=1561998 RepID=A0A1I7V3Y3_9PELO